MKITPEVKQLIKRELIRSIEERAENGRLEIIDLIQKAWPKYVKSVNSFFNGKDFKAFKKSHEEIMAKAKEAGATLYSNSSCQAEKLEDVLNDYRARNLGPTFYARSDKNGITVTSYSCSCSDHPAFDAVRKKSIELKSELEKMADSYVSAIADASMGADFEELRNILVKYNITI